MILKAEFNVEKDEGFIELVNGENHESSIYNISNNEFVAKVQQKLDSICREYKKYRATYYNSNDGQQYTKEFRAAHWNAAYSVAILNTSLHTDLVSIEQI